MSFSRKAKIAYPPGWPGVLSSFSLRDENGRTSEALVDNLPADAAANRFHGALYCRSPRFRQAVAETAKKFDPGSIYLSRN
jgi:hypothetical protein